MSVWLALLIVVLYRKFVVQKDLNCFHRGSVSLDSEKKKNKLDVITPKFLLKPLPPKKKYFFYCWFGFLVFGYFFPSPAIKTCPLTLSPFFAFHLT